MAAEQSSWWVLFLGGLGIGSAITSAISAVIQYGLTRRSKLDERRFTERKEAFTALLVKMAELDRCGEDLSTEAEIQYQLAVARVQLVGSQRVRDVLNSWRDAAPGTQERNERLASLMSDMRNDLGVSK